MPAAGTPADPASAFFPAGWRQGWVRGLEGRTLPYRWGYPGFAMSLLCRAVDPTWAIEWEGEPAPPVAAGDTVTYGWHVGLDRPVAPPLRAAARRPPARDVRTRRGAREPHVDGRGEGRRTPPSSSRRRSAASRSASASWPRRCPAASSETHRRVSTGHSRIAIGVPGDVTGPVRVEIEAEGATLLDETLAGLRPVAARAFHLVPHSHVDIGYSDPQPEVERKQWQNRRDARSPSAPIRTNYKADQQGLLRFRYVLRPHDVEPSGEVTALSRDLEQPLVVLPHGRVSRRAALKFVAEPAVEVVGLRPDGDGAAVLVRLLNASDLTHAARVGHGAPLTLGPWDVATVE